MGSVNRFVPRQCLPGNAKKSKPKKAGQKIQRETESMDEDVPLKDSSSINLKELKDSLPSES